MRENNRMRNQTADNHLKADITADEQLAYLATHLLNDHSQHLDATTLQKLSVARELAVNQSIVRQTQDASIHQSGNVLQWFGKDCHRYFEQHRMMSSLIMVIAIALTFFVAQQFSADKNIAHSDAWLLAAELPPEAFADKGFDSWLAGKQD